MGIPSRLLSAALLVLAALPAGALEPAIAQSVHAKSKEAVVLIHAIGTGAGPNFFYGTGAFVTPEGHVLTSTTVVPPGAKDIRVTLHDGTSLPADVVCVDEPTELAIVRARAPAGRVFRALPWGDSDQARVGDRCFTLGDFFSSMNNSAEVAISEGVVSGRYVLTERAKVALQPVHVGEVVETSAAMNPGTDGGPLVDAKGTLLGILSLNLSPARFQGVAVPTKVLGAKLRASMEGMAPGDREALLRALDASKGSARDAAALDTPMGAAARKASGSLVALRMKRKPLPKRPRPPMPPQPPPGEPSEEAPAEPGPGAPPQPPDPMMQGMQAFHAMIQSPPDLPATALVWDDQGFLLTSYSNVDRADGPIECQGADGRWKPCELVGWHKDYDLALLKAEGTGRPPLPRGSPEALKVGGAVGVLALSPHEGPERHTLETGIVSSLKRAFNSAYQIDARVAHADSGGAVIGAGGDLLGLLTHVDPQSDTGVISGISFMTPLSRILEVEERLKSGAKVEAAPRPYLGFAADMGWSSLGVRIDQVLPGTNAEKGGLRKGDVILEFDGVRVDGFQHIFDLIQSKAVGQKVKLLVGRDDGETALEFVLGERPRSR